MQFDETEGSAIVRDVAALATPNSAIHPIYRKTVLVNGTDVREYEDPKDPIPVPLQSSTLSAVVAMVKSELPATDSADTIMVHVMSPIEVRVLAPVVGDQRQQFIYLASKAIVPAHPFGQMLDMERFNIWLQSGFLDTSTRADILKTLSDVSFGLMQQIVDDGVSQQITAKSKTTRANEISTKNPYTIAPYRTFPEVQQPSSQYLLRLKGGPDVAPVAALFEADGGGWQNDAIRSIHDYLAENLPEGTIIIA